MASGNAITYGSGFGSDVSINLNCNPAPAFQQYLYREIRAGDRRVDIGRLRVEIDAGLFIRSAGDPAINNGGLIVVGRVAVLRGSSGKVPPGPSISTGDTPYGFLRQELTGFDFLFQRTVYAFPEGMTEAFDPGHLYAVGDRSLYVVVGGIVMVQAGSNAIPGPIIDIPGGVPVTLSVLGIDYSARSPADRDPNTGSLPRFGVY